MSHHDRLRILLDQRSSRADIPASYSECSDTPSLYSPAALSPGPSIISYDPPHSMLDLDDDPRLSSESYHGAQSPYEDEIEVEPIARMSYLGPKMRFHSRAPWELEDATLDEALEVEDNPRHFTSGFSFSRSIGQRLSNPAPSSPRPSSGSRPSIDSSNPHVSSKQSLETVNSQISHPRGAFYALAQESLSTKSFARSSSLSKETPTTNLSLARRTEPETLPVPLQLSPNQDHSPLSLRDNEQPKLSIKASLPSNTHDLYINDGYTTSVEESMHPYANPDLVSSDPDDQGSVDDEHFALNYTPPPRHSSVVTAIESSSTSSTMKFGGRTRSSDVLSISKPRTMSVVAKNISSPVSVVGPARQMDVANENAALPPGVNNLPGWTERNAPPTFSLISLEEARAQRTRTSSAISPLREPVSPDFSIPSTPFPSGVTSHAALTEISTSVNIASRARGRSISAGAKAKTAFQSIVGQSKPERHNFEPVETVLQSGSGPHGKSLKHRKSGFLRLFNGVKAQEKEFEDLPPVPALPDMSVSSHSLPRTPKSSAHRIPVPSLSPSLSELTGGQSSNSLTDNRSGKASISQKRLPPTLSINIIHEGPSRSSTSAVAERSNNSMLLRPWQEEQPRTAPPIISEFPALKLRPVSTLFSAFSDHLVNIDSRTSAETVDVSDVVTPRSPSPNGISPLSSTSYSLMSPDKLAIISTASNDQPMVRSLQEQEISITTTWQKQIMVLEGQVRDLKAELEEVRGGSGGQYCDVCGRGKKLPPTSSDGSVINRPRARTATSTRFGHPLP